ncbi:MAG: RNA-binding protein, partial [Gammaproteobacteria bacterium]|nr:RNA-binding protein [Gammaproteobacteria bacterium]
DTGRVRGFAFVTFETQQSAEKALALDGTDLNGRSIRVNVAEAKKSGGAGGSRGGAGGGRSGGGAGRSSGGAGRSSGGAGGNREGGWW